jgi:hypothetical protein
LIWKKRQKNGGVPAAIFTAWANVTGMIQAKRKKNNKANRLRKLHLNPYNQVVTGRGCSSHNWLLSKENELNSPSAFVIHRDDQRIHQHGRETKQKGRRRRRET